MKKLFECEHSYYCNDGNYFDNGCSSYFKSWNDFLEEEGDSDFDMNLIFRWDWLEVNQENGESNFTGDENYRNGLLKLYYLGQRKGIFRYVHVEVCRADEENIRKFLQPRFEHLMNLWEPFEMEVKK